MAVYTCFGCDSVFSKRLTFTYMSWYDGQDLVRYRIAFCDSCTTLERETAIKQGFKRMDDGGWIGPQAVLPGLEGPRVAQNGVHRPARPSPPPTRLS